MKSQPAIINIAEAKAHLSDIIERAVQGEQIFIARHGKKRVRLLPVENQAKNRVPGAGKGQWKINDDFDAPLAPEILQTFYDD